MRPGLAEIARYMRMGRTLPDGELKERVETLAAAAERAATPRRTWKRVGASWFAGRIPQPKPRPACLLCATLGAGFDAWHRRVAATSATDALAAQAIGTAALEKFLDECEGEIRADLAPGETALPRVSPGYGDLPLALSRDILEALDAPRAVGVSLADSLLLVPSKSVTAITWIETDARK